MSLFNTFREGREASWSYNYIDLFKLKVWLCLTCDCKVFYKSTKNNIFPKICMSLHQKLVLTSNTSSSISFCHQPANNFTKNILILLDSYLFLVFRTPSCAMYSTASPRLDHCARQLKQLVNWDIRSVLMPDPRPPETVRRSCRQGTQ